MLYGCQSMVGKIESILLKRPQQAFISQENLNKTGRLSAISAAPIMKRF